MLYIIIVFIILPFYIYIFIFFISPFFLLQYNEDLNIIKVEGPVGMGIPGMDRDMLIFAFPGVAMRTTGPSTWFNNYNLTNLKSS